MAKKRASVKITGVDANKDAILKFLTDQTKEKQFLDELGKLTADQIRNRTRARLEEYKQDPLKTSSIGTRKELIQFGNSFNTDVVKADRSNLSMSGQLLDAIMHKIDVAAATITIFIKRPRAPYEGIAKTILDSEEMDNVEIKDQLEKKGRKFFFISEKLQAQLESKIAQALRKKLSLYNKLRASLK